MKLKPLLILVAVLAAASIITYFVRRPAPTSVADARIGQPLVDIASMQQAAKLRVTEEGKTVQVVKVSGGTWSVPSYYNLPASFSKISEFLADFVDAKVERLVSSNPERIARLGFKDSKVELLDSADKVIWTVTLGKASESGGHFIRFGDESKAYFAPLRTYLDTDPLNWTDQQLIKLSSEDIAKVELTFPKENTTIRASRAKKDDSFVAVDPPGGRKLRSEAIPNLVNSFASLRFSNTSDPDNPEAKALRADNLRTLKLTTFSGQTYTIDISAKIPPPPPAPAPSPDGSPPPPADPRDSIPTAVYVWISNSLEAAPINALMKTRTFHMNEYLYSSVPAVVEDMFEAPAGATVNQPAGP